MCLLFFHSGFASSSWNKSFASRTSGENHPKQHQQTDCRRLVDISRLFGSLQGLRLLSLAEVPCFRCLGGPESLVCLLIGRCCFFWGVWCFKGIIYKYWLYSLVKHAFFQKESTNFWCACPWRFKEYPSTSVDHVRSTSTCAGIAKWVRIFWSLKSIL